MVFLSHNYRELNVKDDELSKEALSLHDGSFIIHGFYDDLLVHDMSISLLYSSCKSEKGSKLTNQLLQDS